MTRSRFRVLALPLALVALSWALRATAVDAQTVPVAQNAPNAQQYGAIARTALSAVNQQRGDCFTWVRSVVQAATGQTFGGDYHTGYLASGATEVSLLSARDGDVIQIANPAITAASANYPGLHTAIVLDNLGGGNLRVIDSNMNFDGIVRIRDPYNPAEIVARHPGVVVRVYRFSGAPGGTPSTPAPLPAQTFASGTLPAPGARVTIAAEGDCLRVRRAAGLAGSVLACLPTGAAATVAQVGPAADGYRWVQVAAGSLTGWVAADYLSTASPAVGASPAPPSRAAVGFAAKPVFSAGSGQASVVFMGAALDQLITAATEAGATGAWVQDGSGAFQLLIVGGPSFMMDAFRARFPAPFATPVAVTLIGTAI